jgi:drug/metabolite transporter (DMT)-like permease
LPAAEIPVGVTLAVLAAGFLHALWNALLKSASGEPMLDTALIVAGATIVCAPLVLVVPLPARAAWPFALASMLVHFAYYVTLAGAYRRGDLSFAYPLMRGVAPLLVTLAGVAVLGEHLRPNALTGIALISFGIMLIAWFASGRHTASAVRWAIANAAIIAAYTLIDGAGARAAGNPWSYAFWLMFLEGIPFVGWILWRHRGEARAYLVRRWRRGMLGGAASVAAYAIALWAMTRAPVAVVAALREVSVVFAAILGTVFLNERFGWRRLAGAASVAAGVAALRF